MFNLSELSKNYCYRATQAFYNLMNYILIPTGCLYVFFGIINLFTHNLAFTSIRYIMFILLALHTLAVILHVCSYLLFCDINTYVYRSGLLYKFGMKIFELRFRLTSSIFISCLGMIWFLFISPVAISVNCKSLNIFQDNIFATIYYVIYLICWFLSAFVAENERSYNSFI